MSEDTASLKALIDVAAGRAPADLVIRGGRWVCVQSGEIVDDTDIAVKDGRVACVGPDLGYTVGKGTQVIEAKGRYLVPGLVDGHMHVESGMVTLTEFVRAAAPRGTTAMFIDPHEIANVFGLRGVKLMVDEAQSQPVHVWVQIPSCVPSAPGLETPGGALGPQEVAEALTWPGVIGLGEMMNYPGVALGDESALAKIAAARRLGKTVGGHYASPDLGAPFAAYAAGGPEDDHEGTRLEDAVTRIRQGMKSMLRYGSSWLDVAAQVRAVTELGLDPRHFILCTDDMHAETLAYEGHMDRALRHAIAEGLDPVVAIQMATLNPAEHFGLAREIGQIAPGRWADVLLVRDLTDFQAGMVICKGRVIAEDGNLTAALPPCEYPDWARASVHLPRPLAAGDFVLPVPEGAGAVQVNVIGVIEDQAPTRHLLLPLRANAGELHADPSADLAKVALVERHAGSGNVTVGLVQGFGLGPGCAVASTVAHDCHHLIVIGTDEACMAQAANALAESGGGQAVVRGGQLLARVELNIAGIISSRPVGEVAAQASAVLEAFRACGCPLHNPNMQLSLLALPVIPELRITDRGLVDVDQFALIPVIE